MNAIWSRGKILSLLVIIGLLFLGSSLFNPPQAQAQEGATDLPPETPTLEITPTPSPTEPPPVTEPPTEAPVVIDTPVSQEIPEQLTKSCTPISFGNNLTGAITAAGEVDCFTFAGDGVIRIRVIGTSGSVTPSQRIVGNCDWTTSQERDCSVGSGTHTIEIKDHYGTGTGNYNIYVQRLNNPLGCTAISFGSNLASSISLAGEADCFTFSGATGDVIRVRLIDTSGSLTPSHDVIAPDGSVLCPRTTAQERDCTLLASGAHTVMVRDHYGTGIGNYNIYVQRLNNPLGCTAISFGSNLASSISLAGEADCFTFSGATGDVIRVRLIDTSGSLTPSHDVIAMDGSVLCPPTTSQERDCTVLSDGTHTIIVRDHYGTGIGNYNIYVQRLNNPLGCTAISFGSNLASSISLSGEADCFTFSGVIGDVIRVRLIDTSGSLTPSHDVIATDGSVLCPPTTSQERDCTLLASGAHTVMVRDHYGTGIGNYNIYVQRLNNPLACTAISFGSNLARAIALGGEADCFTFSGATGDVIRVRLIDTSGSLTPSHDVIVLDGSVLCPPTTSQERDCTLLASGTHTIIVRDHYGTGIGNYNIYVQRLNNPVACTAISFGSNLARAISLGGEADCFTFSGEFGDVIRIRLIDTSGSLTPSHDVIALDGSVLCPPTTSQERDCTLLSTGTHTIIVRDHYGTGIGNYNIYVQRLNNPVACTAISFGSNLARAIALGGEADCFTFSGATGDVIRIRLIDTSGSLTPSHDVIATDGSVLCSPTTSQERDCTLLSSGAHTIIVRDHYGTGIGNYNIYVQRLNNPLACTAISFGSNLAGSISLAGEADCFKFSGTAGDVIRIRIIDTSGSLTPSHDVIAPDGSVLCSPTTSQEQDCTLVSTGLHMIMMRDHYGTGTGNYSISFIYIHTGTYHGWILQSVSTYDGWVLESTENSNVGGSMNSTATTFQVGDDAAKRQYRAILSFDTAVLPDSLSNAKIISVVLKLKRQGIAGTNPFTTHNGLRVDIRKPYFGTGLNLAKTDFQAFGVNLVGTFGATPVNNWYIVTLKATAYPQLNRTGTTQFRLRFGLDDDNDTIADLIKFYSGNAGGAFRPILMIKYKP